MTKQITEEMIKGLKHGQILKMSIQGKKPFNAIFTHKLYENYFMVIEGSNNLAYFTENELKQYIIPARYGNSRNGEGKAQVDEEVLLSSIDMVESYISWLKVIRIDVKSLLNQPPTPTITEEEVERLKGAIRCLDYDWIKDRDKIVKPLKSLLAKLEMGVKK